MSEKKTLIEQLAQKRESFDCVTPASEIQPEQIVAAEPIDIAHSSETRLQVLRHVEAIEHASLSGQGKPSSRRLGVSSSAVQWMATLAVVVMGVCCFVFLPNSQTSTPSFSGKVKTPVPDVQPITPPQTKSNTAPQIGPITVPQTEPSTAPRTEPIKISDAVPLQAVVKAPPQANRPEGTTITVTPVMPTEHEMRDFGRQTATVAPIKNKVVSKTPSTKPSIKSSMVAAKTPSKPMQESQSAATELHSPSVPAVIAKPAEIPVQASSKTTQEASCSGIAGLAAEQCNQCSKTSWLSRGNCEAQIKANYCSSRGRQTPDCAVDYYTRG